MKKLIPIIFLLMAGCASPFKQSGDFTSAFLECLEAHGASVQKVPDLPHIETTWKIETDREGFVVTLPAERFPDVDRLMRRLYGDPSQWTEKNLEGQPQGLFGPKHAGIAIQYVRTHGRTEIIGIKKQEKTDNVQNNPVHATGNPAPDR